MSLLDQIRKDVRHILNNRNEFSIPIIFSTPELSFEVSISGTSTKHHTSYDEIGNPINTRQASVTVAEASLLEVGYPVRNAKGEIYLRDHKVRWADASGNVYVYEIEQWLPDEHLGIIVCILKNAKYVPKTDTQNTTAEI